MTERRYRLKQKLTSGAISQGVWLSFHDPNLMEFYGYLGFDYVIIDAEHESIDVTKCLELVRACDVVGISPIVRPPKNDASTILGFLETGAHGVYVPHVQTAEDARAIVDAVKYAPVGQRSSGGSVRAARYGLVQSAPDYFRDANDETIIIALVEDTVGLANLDEILGVPHIDVVGIGDGDLSHSMGIPGKKKDPELRRIVVDAEARVAASPGKVFDAVPLDASSALDNLARGCRMFTYPDKSIMETAFRSAIERVATATSGNVSG